MAAAASTAMRNPMNMAAPPPYAMGLSCTERGPGMQT